MNKTYRVDVHSHLIPPFWAEELETHGGDPSGSNTPVWSPEQHLSFMDQAGIDVSFLSLTAPGIDGWAIGAARNEMARRVNDDGANLVYLHPRRFGYLATLGLPHVDSASTEIERVYQKLKADGVVLHSNYDGHYLSDRMFDPIWKQLNRRPMVAT